MAQTNQSRQIAVIAVAVSGLFIALALASFVAVRSLIRQPPPSAILNQLSASGVTPQALAANAAVTSQADRLAGRVITADGRPGAGAKLAIVLGRHWVYVEGENFSGQLFGQTFADEQGRFNLPERPGAYEVIAISDDGWAVADQDELAKSSTLTLVAWGRIEGTVVANGKPVAGRQIPLQTSVGDIGDPREPMVRFNAITVTDAQGRFTIERVPAGDGSIGTSPNAQLMSVEPGKTTILLMPENGWPLTGQVQLPPESQGWTNYSILVTAYSQAARPDLPMPPEVKAKPPMERQRWWNDFYKTDAGKAYRRAIQSPWMYQQNANAGGQFRIGGVKPGEYLLSALVMSGGRVVAEGKSNVTIPPTTLNAWAHPIDAGRISTQVLKHLDAGEKVPDFTAATLDGKTATTADYRGRFMLLEVWEADEGRVDGELQSMKKVQEAYGTDPRLALVSLGFTSDSETVRQYATNNAVTWTQWVMRADDPALSELSRHWSIRGSPDIFLIGPDGKLIARDLTGDGVLSAVQNALKNAQ